MYAEPGSRPETEKTFVRLGPRHDATRTSSCQEALWVQYLVLAQFPDCHRVMSNFHAGCGPPSAGDNFRRKVDACLVTRPGHFLLAQYHSAGLHYYNHLADCARGGCYANEDDGAKAASDESEMGEPHEDEVEVDDGRRRSSWGGDDSSSDDDDGDDDDDGNAGTTTTGKRVGDELNWLKGKRGKLTDDGQFGPAMTQQGKGGFGTGVFECGEDLEDAMETEQFALKEKTLEGDAILKSYVAAMNAAVRNARSSDPRYPELEFSTHISYECEYFHGKALTVRDKGGQPRAYTNLRKLLIEQFDDDVITGFTVRRLKERELLKRILYNEEYNGFVTIRGGEEGRDDAVSLAQGFCLGKHKVTAQELGDYAVTVTAIAHGLDPEKDRRTAAKQLDRDCAKRNLTMARRSFGANQLSTLSCLHLRFLVAQRGFHGFRLVHYFNCHLRNYLFDFNFKILQERHRLKKEDPSNELAQLTCKLIFNSSYGYYNLNTLRYHKTSVCTMSTMWSKRKGKGGRGDGDSGKVVSCSLLGHVWAKVKNGPKKPDLLYSVTRKRPDSQIENLAHVSATILELSHVNFSSHLIFLLTTLSPRMAECVYADTGMQKMVFFFFQ